MADPILKPAPAHVSRPGDVTTKDKIKLPVWAWALIGGVGLIVGWRFYQAYKANQAASANASASSPTPSSALPTTVIGPVDNSAQYGNILSAIQGLQGPSSTPTTTTDPYGNGLPQLMPTPGDGQADAIVVKSDTNPFAPAGSNTKIYHSTWQDIALAYGVGNGTGPAQAVAQLKAFNADPKNRGQWGPIDTTQELKSGQRVVVPILNSSQL